MVKIGTGFGIGFAEEIVYGTAAASVAHWLDPRPGMESLQGEVDHITPPSLSFRGPDSAQFLAGMRRVTGSVQHDLRFGGGWPMFLSHLTGHSHATTGAGPYTHVLQLGRDLSLGTTAPQAYGISIIADREGELATAGSKSFVYSGIKPTAVDFDFARGSIATANWTLIGGDSAVTARVTPALSTVPYCVAPSAGTGTLIKSIRYGTDGSETGYNVRAMSLRIEQPLFERRTLEDAVQMLPVAGDNFKVTGSFEIEAPDINTGGNTYDEFIDAYRAVTMKSLLMTAEGPDIGAGTNNSMLFDLPKTRITNVGEPFVGGPGVVVRTVEFEAAYSANASIGVGTFTLTNNEALPYTAGV